MITPLFLYLTNQQILAYTTKHEKKVNRKKEDVDR